ncbi:hypothetical protein HHL11_14610 [Ramlibacter sp. G-1-2-2]|uniref:Uncharacterized protein n=1 Tax=Ramlibacter agri TaxID=2728837 RepID=A0A848H3B6_9BURK|nr:hypothetical protein [Ramlibacter agri]NML44987.1 hypothetical protein [Ramlibacter agri]
MLPDEREALARQLYTVHAQIFAGLDYEGFRKYVVERPSWHTWIYVRHNMSHQLVGYTAIHEFRLKLKGEPSTVIRMEAGTLPSARGRDLTMVYGLMRLLRIWLRHPFQRVCMFAALTHPSSYTFLARYAPVIFPHSSLEEVPPSVMGQMEELAEGFGLERVDEKNPLLRRVDWITLETDSERARWQASTRADTRFYIANNPGYPQGHGLCTLIPLNGLIVFQCLTRFLWGRAGRLTRLALGRPI